MQAISAIVASAKKDLMEPNEILIHSWLKEYFGLKVSMKDWKEFVEKMQFNASI